MKSVYSLVLSDEVVRAVDNAAYLKGVSRSHLINEILAEHLACTTPHMRMQSLFSALESMFQDTALRLTGRSAGAIDLQSAITYRYNPSVRFALVLYERGEDLGELRVSLRTQNEGLLNHFARFFLWFDGEEKKQGDITSSIEEGRYVRVLPYPVGDTQAVSEKLSAYVKGIKALLDVYFSAEARGENGLLAAKSVKGAYIRPW